MFLYKYCFVLYLTRNLHYNSHLTHINKCREKYSMYQDSFLSCRQSNRQKKIDKDLQQL